MKSFVFPLCLLVTFRITKCVSIVTLTEPIIAENKIELKSVEIQCELNEIILAFVPIIPHQSPVYHLYRPNGEFRKLNINLTKRNFDEGNKICINNTKHGIETIRFSNSYFVYKLDYMKHDSADTLEKEISKSDFAIGPLQIEDHGNWILSIYFLNENAAWIEMFQVISVIIKETVPTNHGNNLFLNQGSNFTFRFDFPMNDISSCQLTVPKSTFDRFYTRSNTDFQYCRYFIDNVTKDDEGFWTIIGAGRIIYEGSTYLSVD